MRVLILGAGGMLGRQLCLAFAGHEIFCWDKAELDITDETAVRELVVARRPDLVINAAAYTDVDGAEHNRAAAFALNEGGVRHVAQATKDLGARMVHFSTDYVFPGTQEQGYIESDPPGPAVNVYGESKLAGERALKESGVDFYLMRTAWLYGAGGANFVDTVLTKASRDDELRVINDQHGNPTFANDLAEATLSVVDGAYEPGIYHLVNDGVTTWFEFAQEIFRRAGMEVDVVPVGSGDISRAAVRPRFSVLRSTVGPRMRHWKEALEDYLVMREKAETSVRGET